MFQKDTQLCTYRIYIQWKYQKCANAGSLAAALIIGQWHRHKVQKNKRKNERTKERSPKHTHNIIQKGFHELRDFIRINNFFLSK